jgi:hypothetical protein
MPKNKFLLPILAVIIVLVAYLMMKLKPEDEGSASTKVTETIKAQPVPYKQIDKNLTEQETETAEQTNTSNSLQKDTFTQTIKETEMIHRPSLNPPGMPPLPSQPLNTMPTDIDKMVPLNDGSFMNQ